MRRDINLVIKILEYFEARDETSVIRELKIPGYDNRIVAYHVRRMYEADFLDAEALTSKSTGSRLIDVWPFGLTWQGHEFLDAMKGKGVAAKVRGRLGGSLSEVPFVLIKELALYYFRKGLGL